MSNFNEAADAIRRAAKQYEVFVKAAEILEVTGSLDNAATEAKAARDKAAAERDAVLAELAQAKTELAQAKVLAEAIVGEAQAKSKAVLDEAIAQGTAKAQAKSEAILHNAAQAEESAKVKAVKAADDLDKLKAAMALTQAAAVELDAQIAAKQATLDALNASLDQLKAKLG